MHAINVRKRHKTGKKKTDTSLQQFFAADRFKCTASKKSLPLILAERLVVETKVRQNVKLTMPRVFQAS